MIRRKLDVKLAEGSIKETLMQCIATWQDKPNVKNHRSLWRKVGELVPEMNNSKYSHFNYDPLTEDLSIREGNSKYWFIKYTI